MSIHSNSIHTCGATCGPASQETPCLSISSLPVEFRLKSISVMRKNDKYLMMFKYIYV